MADAFIPIKKIHEVIQSSDVLLHAHVDNNQQRITFPIVRYGSILGRPEIIDQSHVPATGAPYHILETDKVTMTYREIRELCGPIL